MIHSFISKLVFLCGVMVFAFSATQAHAVTLQIDTDSSFIRHTGGAQDHYLNISGTLEVNVNGSQLLFDYSNVRLNSTHAPPPYLWFSTAAYDGLNFQNQLCTNGSCSTHWIAGTYDGSNLLFNGSYYHFGPTTGNPIIETLINASAVPVPGGVWLLGSSLLGLGGLARRKLRHAN